MVMCSAAREVGRTVQLCLMQTISADTVSSTMFNTVGGMEVVLRKYGDSTLPPKRRHKLSGVTSSR